MRVDPALVRRVERIDRQLEQLGRLHTHLVYMSSEDYRASSGETLLARLRALQTLRQAVVASA